MPKITNADLRDLINARFDGLESLLNVDKDNGENDGQSGESGHLASIQYFTTPAKAFRLAAVLCEREPVSQWPLKTPLILLTNAKPLTLVSKIPARNFYLVKRFGQQDKNAGKLKQECGRVHGTADQEKGGRLIVPKNKDIELNLDWDTDSATLTIDGQKQDLQFGEWNLRPGAIGVHIFESSNWLWDIREIKTTLS